ncbi:MAG: hypothetical protein GX285_07160 [Clostridiales bacterium]|nr:hypothetical protein [Clostridiales bacterium]
MKKLVLSIISLLVIFAMTACAEKDLSKDKTAEEILEASINASAKWENYEMGIESQIEMDVPQQGKMKMNMQGSGTVFVNPMKMHMKMDVEIQDMEQNQSIDQYMMQEGDTFVIYQNTEGQWYKIVLDDPGLMEMISMDPMENVQLFLKYLTHAEIVGEEVIDKRNTVKIDMTVSFEMYKELLEKNQALDITGILGTGVIDKLSNIGDFTYTIWIDKENLETVKYYMDLSKPMAGIGDAMAGGDIPAELTEIYKNMKMDLTMTISNQNKSKDFELPAEALTAQEITF